MAMNSDNQQNKHNEQGNETIVDELRQYLGRFLRFVQDWMRPNKQQPRIVQVLLFIIKLPVLALMLVLSPVVLLVLLFVFIAAL